MKIGSALTAAGSPISTLWPPNALLMAALLVSPRRLWPLFLAVLLPAHVVFQRQLGIPLGASLGWFVGNTGEALIGAALLRMSDTRQPLFETSRDVIRFVLFGALLAPILTSFWDAAVVVWAGLGSNYWNLLSTRLFSNVIAIVLFVPPIVMAFEGGIQRLRRSFLRRLPEAAALATTASLICFVLDSGALPPAAGLLEVYAPLPVFVWAALRFGPWESSLAVLVVTLVEIWTLVNGRGPYASGPAAENVLSLQTYSSLIAIPLLLFAVTMEERRRAQRRLRRNEERLELAFAVSRMAKWEWDLRSGELFFSDAKLGFHEVSLDTNLPFLMGVVHPDDREEVRRVHEEAIEKRSSYEVECRVLDEHGDAHWILRKGQVVTDHTGQPIRVFGVSQDITDRKRAEEAERRLSQASRLALVGELTASIAHEINQPLGAIVSNSDVLEMRLESGDLPQEMRHILADIRRDALRASDVIRNVRSLVRPREMQMRELDLHELTSDVLRLAEAEGRRRGVQLETDLASDLPAVLGDRVWLEQLLLNLVMNGMDAMSELPVGQRRLELRADRNGGSFVEVSVTDAGHGIPEDLLPRLFNSFVTTREQGMGFGLSISRSIIEAHGGRIWAENNSGAGATFRFTLPTLGAEGPGPSAAATS
jgi:signal transduction histidine kinase